MALFTSTHFACAAACGDDWRQISKTVLDQLESIRTEDSGFNIGFLYITDALSENTTSIITLFKSVTGIENWVGCAALGVCTVGQEFVDKPAISAMIGRMEEGACKTFFATHSDQNEIKKEVGPWLNKKNPMLILLHGNASSDNHPQWSVERISDMMGGFVTGGLASSRKTPVHYATRIVEEGFSGAAFSSDVQVATCLSQGCRPIGPVHAVTRAEGQVISELDGKKPFEVFSEDLKGMVEKKVGKDPEKIILEGAVDEIAPEFAHLFKGEIHVALPVTGSDRNDYMVRNILGMDPDEGHLAVAQSMTTGDTLMFVHRDDESVRADLSQTLVALRTRVQQERGEFAPKGALYVSCVARAFTEFSHGHPGGEMALVREIIGDIPLTGFYAAGEIAGGRLYGYTGVLILFL